MQASHHTGWSAAVNVRQGFRTSLRETWIPHAQPLHARPPLSDIVGPAWWIRRGGPDTTDDADGERRRAGDEERASVSDVDERTSASGRRRASVGSDATVLVPSAVESVVRLAHDPDGGPSRTLATDVDVADGLLGKAVGLMGQASVSDDYALVFPFGRAEQRSVHMLFVRTPIDVVWTVDDVVERAETLSAWFGGGRARADTIYELAPGAADGVAPGDEVRLEG